MSQQIVVIDTEPALRNAYEEALRQAGFRVRVGRNGREAMEAASKEEPDLMIVNAKLSDMDGDDFCQKIRQTRKVRAIPLLVISGDHMEGLSARCLDSGADGFLVKPVDSQELVAHVRALLRRPRTYLADDAAIRKGRMTIRLAERRVLFDRRDISGLTPKEFALIQELVLRSPRVVEKIGLVMKIWGTPLEQLGRRTLDVHIQRIRRKLGPIASPYLKTVSLVGYQWLDNPPSHR
jgi:DNA-binding response OmpR family regulator